MSLKGVTLMQLMRYASGLGFGSLPQRLELNELSVSCLEASYRVTVSLEQQHISAYGKPQPLKPGMLVEADIIQRKGKLWEWITEPIKGFGQRAI